ncbi:MAG: IlvD/Edd family dehydratase [Porticoccaceae bacterium]
MDKKQRRRSRAWFEGTDRNNFIHRSWLKNQGHPEDMFDGRPIIGICNTWSELTPCNAHLRQLAERVKCGIYEAGGFPLEFPVMSLGESLMRPTTMLFRNLVSMDVEESIRANPIDGVVLLGGCDKTTPALLMGASSCDLPAIVVSGGPMLNGKFRGQDIGSGTSLWELSEDVRAGKRPLEEMLEAESGMSRSSGSCMTMGTASTMATLAEVMGIAFPQNGAIPAVDSRRMALAQLSGRRIVELVETDVKISKILNRQAFENAIVANAALGGSTNAIVHLIAIAGRLGVPLDLEDWGRIGANIPCIANIMPSGQFLMEDFYYAGGVPALLREIGEFINKDSLTVNGQTLWENVKNAPNHNPNVIRSPNSPVTQAGGVALLRGNLAERGAVIKPSSATPALMEHRGKAIVFETPEILRARIDDPDLDIDPSDVLVLKNAGPLGYPGFPEVGNMPLPRRILEQGVTDMVRISDGRMSGTAYGTVVLHVAPEAAAGGVLALVKTGDMIELSVSSGRLHLDVEEEELERRRLALKPYSSKLERGYVSLYVDHVLQADQGVDFDFLVGGSGAEPPADSH